MAKTIKEMTNGEDVSEQPSAEVTFETLRLTGIRCKHMVGLTKTRAKINDYSPKGLQAVEPRDYAALNRELLAMCESEVARLDAEASYFERSYRVQHTVDSTRDYLMVALTAVVLARMDAEDGKVLRERLEAFQQALADREALAKE